MDSRLREVAASPRREIGWEGTVIRDHLSKDDWKSLDAELNEQIGMRNDRGVAITCASMIDDRLRWTIETKFVGSLSNTRKNWLFAGAGPFATYKARVELAHALGLVSDDFRQQLLLIGRIRNKFAHSFRRVRFAEPEITGLCEKLEAFGELAEIDRDPMKNFAFVCFAAMITLLTIGNIILAASNSGVSPSPEKSE